MITPSTLDGETFIPLSGAGADFCPFVSVHVTEQRRLPSELSIFVEVGRGFEVQGTGVSGGRQETHLRNHRGIGDLILHSAGGLVRSFPVTHAANREIDVSAKRPFTGLNFS